VDSSNHLSEGQDRDSLERELESFRTYLLFVAWRLKERGIGGPEGASDLVAQTLMAALEKVREGNIPGPDKKHRRAWLRKILIRTSSRLNRRQQAEIHGGGRVVTAIEEPVPDSATSPSGEAVRNEEQRLLADAFARLEPAEQELIRWRYIDELTWEEIGRRKGFSATYACRTCKETLARLRASVKTA
jgi:RNA polymerase sigma factor (sigma-70 family)